jgi:hypothetical protein
MTVTDLSLNRHEKDILSAIEESMPDGIHVQGIIKEKKISPTTVNHYLPILENERKLVYHERIKNKDVYKIKIRNEKTFQEQKEVYAKNTKGLENTIQKALKFASKRPLAEQLDIYGHITFVLAMIRQIQNSEVLDGQDVDSIPTEHLNYLKELERISLQVSESMDSRIHPLHLLMVDKSIDSSRKFLEDISKTKKKTSKNSV